MRVELDTTDPPPPVAVSSPAPASAPEIRAPAVQKASAPAPEPGVDISKEDVELRERVQRAVGRSPSLSYTAKHVQVEVVDQRVTLRGEVRNADERREIDQIVRSLPGVKQLHNRVALINRTSVIPAR